MKRLIIVLCVVAFLVTLPMSHLASANEMEKSPICHLNSANDVIGPIAFGTVIIVSDKSYIVAHEAHGDSQTFRVLSEQMRDVIEEMFGISLPNADCYFNIPIPAPD